MPITTAQFDRQKQSSVSDDRFCHEERFQAMVYNCPSMMWATGTTGTIEFFNGALHTFFGTSGEEASCGKYRSLIHPDDAPEYVAAFDHAIAERIHFRAEARFRRADGEWRLIGSNAKPCLSLSGEYMGHVGVCADITESRHLAKARQFELSLIRSIHEETQEGILVVDSGGHAVSLNKRFLRMWGLQNLGAVDPSSSHVVDVDDRLILSAAVRQVEAPEAFQKRVHELYEHPDDEDHCEIALKDGRTLERHSTGLRDQDGKYLGRVWFFRDITAHKQAEVSLQTAKDRMDEANRLLISQRAIQESERQMLRVLIDNIPDFMYVKDTSSKFIVANYFVARQMGANSPEEVLGKSDLDFYPPELANKFLEDEQKMILSGESLYNHEEDGMDTKGNRIRVLTTKVPIRNADGQVIGLAGVGRDITSRTMMERALREAEQKFRGIFDNAIVGMFQITPEGSVLNVNPAMASIFGYESAQEMFTAITDLTRDIFVDSRKHDEFVRLMNGPGEVQNYEFQAYRKDRVKIWVSMSIRPIHQDGETIRHDGMCEDITERTALREQLLQAQKLESVGQLAAGIAHEINTPTQYIGDNVRFLKDAFDDIRSLLATFDRLLVDAQDSSWSSNAIHDVESEIKRVDSDFLLEEIPRAIEQTLEGLSRVTTLVSAMKEFSHPGTKEKIPLDLNHSIDCTITVARNEWKYVADLETDFDPSLPSVLCQPGEINQVILNMIVNAAHAIDDVVRDTTQKGKITIQTRNCPDWAEIRIQDTGSGIPEEARSRIFDPFFTTKEIGKGTGQGLAIARSVVVDKHGGTIHFETETGKGTSFIIRLPHHGTPLAGKAVAA